MIVCGSSSEEEEPCVEEPQIGASEKISTSSPKQIDCHALVQTWIVHLDVDNFYVAAELLRRPELKGRCVAVCQYNSGGFVALSAEAKLAGLRKGDGVGDGGRRNIQFLIDNNNLSIEEAQAKCVEVPGGPLEILPMDTDYYLGISWQIYHRLVKQLASCNGGIVQKASYDDFYIDISSAVEHRLSTIAEVSLRGYVPEQAGVKVGGMSKAEIAASDVAGRLKDDLSSFGLQVTLGVGPNKLIARMASSLAKPSLRGDNEGLALVPPCFATVFVGPQPIASVHGLGAKLGTKVSEALGVIGETLGSIAATPSDDVSKILLNAGVPKDTVQRLIAASVGDCSSKVVASGAPKSTLAERSFPPIDTGDALTVIVTDLAKQLLRRCAAPVHGFGRRVPRKLRISYRVGYDNAQAALPTFTIGSVPLGFASAIAEGNSDNVSAMVSITESIVQSLSKKLTSPWQLTRLMITAFEFGDFLGNSKHSAIFASLRNNLCESRTRIPLLKTGQESSVVKGNGAQHATPTDKSAAGVTSQASNTVVEEPEKLKEKERSFLVETGLDAATFAELPANLRQQLMQEREASRGSGSTSKTVTVGVAGRKHKATLDMWFSNLKDKVPKVVVDT